jgi:hypothetical protein
MDTSDEPHAVATAGSFVFRPIGAGFGHDRHPPFPAGFSAGAAAVPLLAVSALFGRTESPKTVKRNQQINHPMGLNVFLKEYKQRQPSLSGQSFREAADLAWNALTEKGKQPYCDEARRLLQFESKPAPLNDSASAGAPASTAVALSKQPPSTTSQPLQVQFAEPSCSVFNFSCPSPQETKQASDAGTSSAAAVLTVRQRRDARTNDVHRYCIR